MPTSIPVVNAASISRSLENATAAQLNSFFDNALHVGPYFLSEQTVTPHAEEKHLFGIDINYSDINQPPYVGLGVNSARVGWNLNGAGRIDPDYSGFALCWEHRYTLNDNLLGVLVDEFHFLGTSRDAPPEDWRMFSMIKPQIAADAGFGTDNGYISSWGFVFYQSTLGAGDGDPRVVMEWFEPKGGYVEYADGVGLQFSTPAYAGPIMQQKNAAGSALLALPYINATEALQISQPIVAAGGTNSVTNAFLDLTPSAATTGQKAIVVNGPTLTGSYFAASIEASPTVDFVFRVWNSSATANSSAKFQALSSAAAGIASSQYVDGSTGTGAEAGWNSAEARYLIAPLNLPINTYAAISINPYPATTPTTTIFGTCNLPATNMNAPLNLKSYTVGTLPSAATDGGFIYVTNEAGGEQPAFSDGTNWRRCASGDRAIVS